MSEASEVSRRIRWPVVLLLTGLLAALLFSLIVPLLHTDRHGRGYNVVRCGSNLRQIGLAIQMYANDNDDRVPPSLEVVMMTQDLPSEVFVCPSTDDERAVGSTTQALVEQFRTPGHCSYTLAIAGPEVLMSSLTKDHVLVYERHESHSDLPGMNILFGDGHVEWIDKNAAAHVTSELKGGFNPPRPKR